MRESRSMVTMHEYRLKIVNRVEFDQYLPLFASSVDHAYRRFDEVFMSMHNNRTPLGNFEMLGELGRRHDDAVRVELIDWDSGAVIASFDLEE